MTKTELLAACAGGMPFTAEMARAIMDGHKTRTMRLIKNLECGAISDTNMDFRLQGSCMICTGCIDAEESSIKCIAEPKYKPGDIVYAQEPWCHVRAGDIAGYMHKGDCGDMGAFWQEWEPADTMPPEAARAFMRITDVKPQRPMELTYEEICAEGYREHGGYVRGHEASDWWDNCIRSIYPSAQHGENPWCYAYIFEREVPTQ